MQLANRDGFACPACGKESDRLFVSEKRENTFGDPAARSVSSVPTRNFSF